MKLLPVLEATSDEARVAEILSLFYRMKTSWHLAESYRESLSDAKLSRAARLALGDRVEQAFYSLHNQMAVLLEYLIRLFAKQRGPGLYQIGRYEVRVLSDGDAIIVDTDRLLLFDLSVVIHSAEKR